MKNIKKDNKVLNVPHLRFKEFSGEWGKYRCSDFLTSFPANSLSWEMLSYDGNTQIYNLHYGLIHNGAPTLIDTKKYKLPCINSLNIKNQTQIYNGDVIFADASEDTIEIGKCIEFINTNNQIIYSGLHTIHTRDTKDLTVLGFKAFLFQSNYFHKQVERITQGTKIYSLNFTNFKELYVNIPNKKEQEKIATFLTLIDKRIETQMKIIEEYKSLINNLHNNIIKALTFKKWIKLSNLCSITTGKLDANAMSKNGKYKFFTCSKEDYYINEYAFDGEALIISGNGDLGLIKHYNGKFNAYQRTYVLQNFKINPIYLEFMMKYYLPRKIYKEKNIGAMPYIVLKTLADLNIPIISEKESEILTSLYLILTNKLNMEQEMLDKLKQQKNFLLNNMFI